MMTQEELGFVWVRSAFYKILCAEMPEWKAKSHAWELALAWLKADWFKQKIVIDELQKDLAL